MRERGESKGGLSVMRRVSDGRSESRVNKESAGKERSAIEGE